MITITIIAVGSLKERFYADGVNEYEKRLSAFCKINSIVLSDEKIPASASEKEKQQIMKKEGDRILGAIPKSSYTVALDVQGKKVSSEQLADRIDALATGGVSHIAFIIGGSLGLHKSVTDACNASVSLSNMTFTHQMARLVLTEQIYRAFTILNNKPYHR